MVLFSKTCCLWILECQNNYESFLFYLKKIAFFLKSDKEMVYLRLSLFSLLFGRFLFGVTQNPITGQYLIRGFVAIFKHSIIGRDCIWFVFQNGCQLSRVVLKLRRFGVLFASTAILWWLQKRVKYLRLRCDRPESSASLAGRDSMLQTTTWPPTFIKI